MHIWKGVFHDYYYYYYSYKSIGNIQLHSFNLSNLLFQGALGCRNIRKVHESELIVKYILIIRIIPCALKVPSICGPRNALRVRIVADEK